MVRIKKSTTGACSTVITDLYYINKDGKLYFGTYTKGGEQSVQTGPNLGVEIK